jgi:hypothetical protein
MPCPSNRVYDFVHLGHECLLLLGLQRVDELLPMRACHDPHRRRPVLLAMTAGWSFHGEFTELAQKSLLGR